MAAGGAQSCRIDAVGTVGSGVGNRIREVGKCDGSVPGGGRAVFARGGEVPPFPL